MLSDFVKKYTEREFNIIALKPREKLPAVPKLAEYFERKSTAEEHKTWFEGKEQNIGVITGSISHLFVLDIDGDEAKRRFQETVPTLSRGLQTAINATMSVLTGSGGAHLYFKTYQKVNHKKLWLGEGHNEIAIKGEGGYVVAPPSVHPNGNLYKIVNDNPPILLSDAEVRELMGVFGVSERTTTPQKPIQEPTSKVPLTPERTKKFLDLLAPHYIEGRRNELALHLAGYLRKIGVPFENATQFIGLLAERTGDREKESRVESVRRTYEKNISEISGYSALKELLPEGVVDALSGEEVIARAEQVLEPIELTPELTRELSFDEIAGILSSTIKKDDAAKLITFCSMILAQTESDQINIGFQSESSAGKSYIPTEMSLYFPDGEVMPIAGASPTAFFHERGEWNEEQKTTLIDLEGKILLFLDQPHYKLLETLRPMLSHDKKELEYKITDKNKSGQNRTKRIIVRGFPSVAFSTTKMNPDEQEKTRMIMLSPSVDHDKLEEALRLLTVKKGDPEEYDKLVNEDPGRIFLTQRIKAIRQTKFNKVVIPNSEELIFKRFMGRRTHLIARHQRDYPRIFSLIKAHALLNCFNRERKNGSGIIASQLDIDAGFKLYEMIEESNEIGLSPHIYQIYEKVIKPLMGDIGTDRKQIQRQYYLVYHKMLQPRVLNEEILPQLEAAGLILQEPDPEDKRRMMIVPAYYERNINVQTLDVPVPRPQVKETPESQFWETLASLKAIVGTVTYNSLVGELMSIRKWPLEEAEKYIDMMERKGKIMGVPNNITRITPT